MTSSRVQIQHLGDFELLSTLVIIETKYLHEVSAIFEEYSHGDKKKQQKNQPPAPETPRR